MSEVRQAVMKFLVDLCPNDQIRAGLTEHTELMEAGVLDSFAVVRLIEFMEEEFDVRIPDADIGPALFSSGAAISSYIERQRGVTAVAEDRVPASA